MLKTAFNTLLKKLPLSQWKYYFPAHWKVAAFFALSTILKIWA
jgi:hypothetical protein